MSRTRRRRERFWQHDKTTGPNKQSQTNVGTQRVDVLASERRVLCRRSSSSSSDRGGGVWPAVKRDRSVGWGLTGRPDGRTGGVSPLTWPRPRDTIAQPTVLLWLSVWGVRQIRRVSTFPWRPRWRHWHVMLSRHAPRCIMWRHHLCRTSLFPFTIVV